MVKVRDTDQIGHLAGPEVTAAFGRSTTAAVEDRINQGIVEGQHQSPGLLDRAPGAGGLRLHPLVDLAGHRGLEIKGRGGLAGLEGIGAGRHRLGLQGRIGPARRHLAAHHAGEIGLHGNVVDHLKLPPLTPQLQATAVATLAEPEPGVGGGSLGHRLKPQLLLLPLGLEAQFSPGGLQPQLLTTSIENAEAARGHSRPQAQAGGLQDEHPQPGLRRPQGRHRQGSTDPRGPGDGSERSARRHRPQEGTGRPL